MSATSWSGRKVRRLVALTLANKGTVCHLCRLDGANSADHNPPRSALLAAGVPDPDALCYLWPAHRQCNLWRGNRPITSALRASCRRRMLAARGEIEIAATTSPRFAIFPVAQGAGSPAPALPLPNRPEKS